MAKSLFEELGGKYERQGDYLIPCLTVPAERTGNRHLGATAFRLSKNSTVKLHTPIFLTSGRLKRLPCRHQQTGTGTL